MVFCCSSKTNRFPKQLYTALSYLKLKKLLHTQMHLADFLMGPVNFVLKFEEYQLMRFVIVSVILFFCDSFL